MPVLCVPSLLAVTVARHVRSALATAAGNMSTSQPGVLPGTNTGESKTRGANRSTKVAGKLKVLPEHAEPVLQKDKSPQPPPPPRAGDEAGEGSGTLADSEDEDVDEDTEPEDVEVSGRWRKVSSLRSRISPRGVPFVFSMQVYNQIDLIPAGTARRDALRLTKKKAKSLPRVTAYATAGYVSYYALESLVSGTGNRSLTHQPLSLHMAIWGFTMPPSSP